jgi:pyruvate/2-oxoacid:ferredoxin oxidoreductase beta subunit
MHNAFENAASTVSGIEAAYRSLVRQGKIPEQNVKFIAYGGDGGTYDTGIQGRVRHLFKPENEHMIDEMQAEVDRRWEQLLERCGEA